MRSTIVRTVLAVALALVAVSGMLTMPICMRRKDLPVLLNVDARPPPCLTFITRPATLNLVPLVHVSLLGSYPFGLGIQKKETSRSSPPHLLQKLVNGNSPTSHRLQGNRNKLLVKSFNIKTVSQRPSSCKEECHESYES